MGEKERLFNIIAIIPIAIQIPNDRSILRRLILPAQAVPLSEITRSPHPTIGYGLYTARQPP